MKYFEASRWRPAFASSPMFQVSLVCVGLSVFSSAFAQNRFELPANTQDFRNRVYAGASFGSSRLQPDTTGTVFDVGSDSAVGTQLRLGYDMHNLLAIELDTSVLGKAELRNVSADVQYSSATLSALVYGLSGSQLRSRREGLSAYARFGYGTLRKSTSAVDLQESIATPVLGLGAEYGFTNGLGIRAELTRFDADATFAGFGAVYRFGISPAGIRRMVAEAAEPALASAHTVVDVDGRTLSGNARNRITAAEHANVANTRSSPAVDEAMSTDGIGGADPWRGDVNDRWRPTAQENDQDVDGVLDESDSCPDTAMHVTVDRFGCGLFDTVLEDVTFKTASSWLTPKARGQLDRVADTLLAFPEARVQVRAHTDSTGPADINLEFSMRRAEVVVQYLHSRGVDEKQLQALGMGEAQPLASNSTESGRRQNRRVDLITLPDMDARDLMLAENVATARVVSVSDPARVQADQQTTAEPALQAANPLEDESQAAQEELPQIAQSALMATLVEPLPEPGFVTLKGIVGVVEGLDFLPGEATLDEQDKQALEPLLAAMQADTTVRIAIMAHTDNVGDAQSNLQLSRLRAEAVLQHLLASGIAESRMTAEGYGEMLPLVQNMTDEDRERNRRIDIRTLP